MYKQNSKTVFTGTLKENKSYEGERLEIKILRLMTNGEPIGDASPLIYTERKDGVLPEYNIRTDRFDIAIEAMDKGSKSYRATREERHAPLPKTEQKTEDNTVTAVLPTPNPK